MPFERRGGRGRTRLVASAAGVALALFSASAGAAPFDLAWTAPEGCPTRERIVDATRANLGEPPSTAPPELFVRGAVAGGAEGFVISLSLEDAVGASLGERDVRVAGQRCEAIEEPTALVLAMMIAVARPSSAPPPPDDAAASERSPAPVPSTKPPTRQRPPPPSPSPERLARVTLAGGAVASLGLLPVVGLGAALRGTYSPVPRVLVGLETTFERGGSIRAGGGEVGFQLLGASAFGGYELINAQPLELMLTVGLRAALVRVFSTGFEMPVDEARAVALAGPGLLVRGRITPNLFVEGLSQVEGVLIRDEFELRSGDVRYPIHRPFFVEARFSLGLGWQFR
ncbi:MAG: hypothetical protein K0S65_4583 [Labilithrix sp.]|nr:hypothetical protein [Labilithrix sp.]